VLDEGESTHTSMRKRERLVRMIVEYVTCVLDITEKAVEQTGLPAVMIPCINPITPEGIQYSE